MGKLTGTCRTLAGDNIRVTFTCTRLATQDIDICELTTQVQGGLEYSPVKYATASITILSDGVELMPLCTTDDTTVTITNTSTGKMLFSGYVTRNTFSQSLIADTLTVECVDKLGYTKFLSVPEIALIQSNTLALWIQSFAEDAGLSAWLSKSAKIRRRSDSKTTGKYYLLTIPGEYFLKDTKPTIWGNAATYEGQKMSIFDALAMIAESLRMTFIQVGDVLRLEEPTDRNIAKSYIIVANNGAPVSQIEKIRLNEESFADSDNTVSTLPEYTSFSLLHKSVAERSLNHPVFNSEYLLCEGSGVAYIDGDEKTFCERMKSMLAETVSTGSYRAEFVAYKTYKVSEIGSNDAKRYYNTDWSTTLRISSPGDDGCQHEVYRMRGSLPRTVSPCRGRAIKLRIKLQLTEDANVIYPKKPVNFESFYLYASLKVGNRYLNYSFSSGEWGSDLWVTSPQIVKLNILPDGEVYLENGLLKRLFEFPYTFSDNGRADVELILYAGARRFTCFVDDINIVEKIDSNANPNAIQPTLSVTEYFGKHSEDKTLSQVELPIDLYSIMSDKSYGTIIEGVDYAAGKVGSTAVGAELLFGDDNKTMIEKIAAMAKVEDGLQFDLSLNDKHNDMQLSQQVTSSLWAGVKTVVGYEKNILDSTIKVTLI